MSKSENRPEILSYGEDALTLWALTVKAKRKEIFTQITQKTGDALDGYKIFYRPSFGRGNSCLGEFDFIIISDKSIFLGESKWDQSSSYKKRKCEIVLGDDQINRHNKFLEFIGNSKENDTSLLAHNINDFKKIASTAGKNIINILLFFYKEQIESINKLAVPPKFIPITTSYSEILFGETNFIDYSNLFEASCN